MVCFRSSHTLPHLIEAQAVPPVTGLITDFTGGTDPAAMRLFYGGQKD